MRFAQGDGYGLFILTRGQPGVMFGPGAALISHGTWMIGDLQVGPGADFHGIELMGPTKIVGAGLMAVAIETKQRPCPLHDAPIPRELVRHDKPWGYELEVPTDAEQLQLKYLSVDPGHRTSLQKHVHKDEIMVFSTGEIMRVRPGEEHRVAGPASYFEASSFHPDDVIRLGDDYGRPTA